MGKVVRRNRGFRLNTGLIGGAARALRLGYRMYKGSRTRTRGKFQRSGAGVTGHFDQKWIYKRKRMPRRKRKQWTRFVKKVDAANHRGLGTQSIVFNASDTLSWPVGTQGFGSVALYGLFGGQSLDTIGMGTADLNKIVGGLGYQINEKIMFRSAVLDVTFTNTGVPGEDGSNVEVDVYEYVWKKQNVSGSAQQLYFQAAANTPTLPGALGLLPTSRGATPFQFPEASQFLKVLNKKKYLLPVGASATYQVRDPKNRIFDCGTAFVGETGAREGLIGWTKGIIIIAKGIANLAGTDPLGGITVGCTRTYSFKKEDVEGNNDGFLLT